MRKNYLISLLIFFSHTVIAQVSWLSKPTPSTPYVAPVDQSILFQSMAHRQQQLDRNVEVMTSTVEKARDEADQLSSINEKDSKAISRWIEEDLDILRARSIDYSQTRNAQRILDRFNEYRRIIRWCYKGRLPDEIDLETPFF